MPNIQVTFESINPTAPVHALASGELQTGTNLDFSIGQGALMPRRGSVQYGVPGTGTITQVFRNYTVPNNIDANPFYVVDANSVVWRGSNSSWTAITTGVANTQIAMNGNNQYALIAAGTNFVKDDGTLTTDWILQNPSTPSLTVNTLTPIDLTTSGTFNIVEGNGTASGGTATVGSDNNNIATVLMTFASAIDLSVNGSNKIGPFGVHFIDLAFDNPINIIRVSQDFATQTSSSLVGIILTTITITNGSSTTTTTTTSIGTSTATGTASGTTISNGTATTINFDSYWHNEVNPSNGIIDSALPDPNNLINTQIGIGTLTASTPSLAERATMLSEINNSQSPTLSGLTQLGTTYGPWGACRPDFGMVGTFAPVGNADPWANILAMRYVFQYTDVTTATLRNPAIYGANNFPLTDVNLGYTYWQTYAVLDTNTNKVAESAASSPTTAYQMQQAQVKVVTNGSATGSHGINAIITYRQGGYLQTAYAVNTQSYSTKTFTDTMNDIQALSLNFPITLNLFAKNQFPGDTFAIAQVFQGRVFTANDNVVRWSLPGQISSFPQDSFVSVSNFGDNVKGLITWPPGLIIVNQDSVYELTGSDFETGAFQLIRSGARRGSFAPNSIIKTPYGIPLLNYDGLTLYQPGQGVDLELPWLIEKYGDMFRGGNSNDIAARRGSRIPALNYGMLINACAGYAEGKLYIGAATGTSTVNNTVYVIDLIQKKCWWYEYPFNVWALWWDYQNNRMIAGSDNGALQQLEHGDIDEDSLGTASNIVWSAVTRQWSVNNDTVMENISIDSEGNSISIVPIFDNILTTNTALLTNTVRRWQTPALNGTFANAAAFSILGTEASTYAGLYQINFDLIDEPVRVRYYRTPYDEHNYEADKLWDVAYFDIDIQPGITTATGTDTHTGVTVLAVTFIDTVAVMTNTLAGPTNGREVFESAFPSETYGRVAYTTYTVGTLTQGTFTNTASTFKLWTTQYEARNEPPKINYWHTDWQSLEENICDAFDVDINPNGTVTATAFVDNVIVQTSTIVGSKRQSFTFNFAEELYGRTLFIEYTGTGFKHYKTWFHLRLEPDRWTSLVTNKITGDEHEWKVFKPELNCLGHVVLCTAFIDGQPVGTYTASGTVREQFTFSLPIRTFGRTTHAAYASADGGVFKHYPWLRLYQGYEQIGPEFEGQVEPPRVTTFRTGPYPFPSSNYLKTWLAELDPLTGTVTGTLIVDDTVIATASFTGDRKQWFTVGLDLDNSFAIETGSRWEAVYSDGADNTYTSARFKHYESKMETEEKPFGKSVWAYSYRKLGGASQLDLARFWSLDIDALDLSTCTYFWDIDGVNFTTGTITFTGGVEWIDRIPFPPGARGYLFLFRLAEVNGNNVKVNKVNLDLDQEGIKGLVRRETHGTPPANAEPHV